MKNNFLAAVIALAATLLILALHLTDSFPSILNFRTPEINLAKDKISESHLAAAVAYHKAHPAFARRPVSTYLIESVHQHATLSLGEAFIFVNFLLLFACALLVYFLARCIGCTGAEAIGSMLFFFGSFTILFIFFPPIYTYDEPAQYFFLLLSLIAFFKEKYLSFFVCFSLSLMVRESSILLLPGLLYLFLSKLKYANKPQVLVLKQIALLLTPIAVYIIFLYFLIQQQQIWPSSKIDFWDRLLHFSFNFQSVPHAVNTFVSFFLTLGLQLYLVYWFLENHNRRKEDTRLLKAFFITLFINTPVVLTTTLAVESRLYALPLLFLWPLLGKIVKAEWRNRYSLSILKHFLRNWLYMGFLLLCFFLSVCVTRYVYVPTDKHAPHQLFKLYLLLCLCLLFFDFLYKHFLRTRPHNP
ncbi:hypothetical protein FVR03_01640 [Pontibacter qinzhouensis]|uniref:Glycosyltransferase RgtA/B/C/D-like domain-containing protein n=1 Tax=Pontibacter qinzhouensis TaxID=2603253 RepID=A0A5C8KCX3_9BACT|nr:hypothetical protein [Pontibacter qinzhouensis]TXK52150.1 hypothetical protein FVR03_01640 [Pontibacter qinzhouensis]